MVQEEITNGNTGRTAANLAASSSAADEDDGTIAAVASIYVKNLAFATADEALKK